MSSAVPLGGVHGPRIVRRDALVHQARERLVHGVALGLEPRPVLLRVPARAPRRLLVGLGLAPARLGLRLVLRRVEVAEDFEHVAAFHRDPFVHRGQRLVDEGEHGVDAGGPARELLALRAQGLAPVEPGLGEQVADLAEPEPELLVQQHRLQPLQVFGGVQAVAGRGPRRRAHQADPVVVVQGAHAHVGEPRHLSDPARSTLSLCVVRVAIIRPASPSDFISGPRIDPDVTSGSSGCAPAHRFAWPCARRTTRRRAAGQDASAALLASHRRSVTRAGERQSSDEGGPHAARRPLRDPRHGA